MVAASAETMQLRRLMGLEDQHFADLLDGGPLGCRYGLEKRVGQLVAIRRR